MNPKIERFINKLYDMSIDHYAHWRRHLKEYFWAILVALSIRAFCLVIYRIPTGSMIPSLKVGDTLIANRFWYGMKLPFTDGLPGWRVPGFDTPEVGDVIVFRAPREVWYEVLELEPLSEQAWNLLKEINQDAAVIERPLMVPGPDSISALSNFIFAYPINQNAVPKIIAQAYLLKKLEPSLKDPSLFRVYSRESFSTSATYQTPTHPGWLTAIIDTPLAGTSILTTAALKSPFLWLHRFIVTAFMTKGEGSSHFGTVMESMDKFSLYPNRNQDMTKDFVKRMIADENDTVEIRAKKLFVNGIEYVWDGGFTTESEFDASTGTQQNYVVGKEIIRYQKKDGKEILKSHAVRFNAQEFENSKNGYAWGGLGFVAGAWPYHPITPGLLGPAAFKDDFGPIKVPAGHVFAMGDNRDNSSDCRFWGFIPKEMIKGHPDFVFLPRLLLID